MFGPPGIAYVYLVYGMHDCLNIVTEPAGRAGAVLIRAVETLDSPSAESIRTARWERWLQRQRAPDPAQSAAERDRLARLPVARLASGPGLVTAAFDITRGATGADLLDPTAALRIEPGDAPSRVEATPRIGIGYAAEPWRSHPWRFVDPDSPALSGARARGSAS